MSPLSPLARPLHLWKAHLFSGKCSSLSLPGRRVSVFSVDCPSEGKLAQPQRLETVLSPIWVKQTPSLTAQDRNNLPEMNRSSLIPRRGRSGMAGEIPTAWVLGIQDPHHVWLCICIPCLLISFSISIPVGWLEKGKWKLATENGRSRETDSWGEAKCVFLVVVSILFTSFFK